MHDPYEHFEPHWKHCMGDASKLEADDANDVENTRRHGRHVDRRIWGKAPHLAHCAHPKHRTAHPSRWLTRHGFHHDQTTNRENT